MVEIDVIAERLDSHLEQCKVRDERTFGDMREIKHSIEKLADGLDESLRRIHGRIDASNRQSVKWISGLTAAVFVLLTGIIGYLIVNGTPWSAVP